MTCDTPWAARPYAVIIRSTERCDVGCAHCCISAARHGRDMSLRLAKLAIRQAKDAGIGLVHISGGEPLLNADVDAFVAEATECGLYVELTTSTFASPVQDSTEIVARLQRAGLRRMMLSYDDAHAQRVPFDHYVAFAREAQRKGIEVCAVVVESTESEWTATRLADECGRRGIDASTVDWCTTELSEVGRAARSRTGTHDSNARCPYVLVAPTVTPDGTVFLCPNLVSRSKLFKLGNISERTLKEILDEMLASRFYRSLAFYGPGAIAVRIGITRANGDMCGTCQTVLREAENPSVREAIETMLDSNATIPLDIDALLPGHRRFVTGETPGPGGRC